MTTDSSKPCAGDANGLFRNATDAACFRQYPQPETPRQNYNAYQVLTTYVNDVEPLHRAHVCLLEKQNWVSLYKPSSDERLLAMWACVDEDQTAVVNALGKSALLVASDGSTQSLTPVNGKYTIQLPAATNTNPILHPHQYPVGGRTYILIEKDENAPTAEIEVVAIDGNAMQVEWSASDGLGGGVASYDVSVAVNGNTAQPWLVNTTTTSASFTGQSGVLYDIIVVAKDKAGNESAPVSASSTGSGVTFEMNKVADHISALPGDNINYEIMLTNTALLTTNIQLTDNLPTGMSYVNNTLDNGSGSGQIQNGKLTWSGVLAPNETTTLAYQLKI
ncbi:MAG: DUF11 domain-containing protein, partial [Methylococcales bacterium]|nr:DUF11 domain-containing protein [Methylococcales bacterium]